MRNKSQKDLKSITACFSHIFSWKWCLISPDCWTYQSTAKKLDRGSGSGEGTAAIISICFGWWGWEMTIKAKQWRVNGNFKLTPLHGKVNRFQAGHWAPPADIWARVRIRFLGLGFGGGGPRDKCIGPSGWTANRVVNSLAQKQSWLALRMGQFRWQLELHTRNMKNRPQGIAGVWRLWFNYAQ